MTITEFLLARIAEDERMANMASGMPIPSGSDRASALADAEFMDTALDGVTMSRVRLLAECEVKRRIVARHRPEPAYAGCVHCGKVHGPHGDFDPSESMACPVCSDGSIRGVCEELRILASVYADHQDYRQEWA